MIQVTAAIFFELDNVLIMRRAPGQKHAGKWEFPGGKLEENESFEGCLARELKEELLVEATIGELLAESIFTYDSGQLCLFAYKVKDYVGEIHLTVHDQLEWVPISFLLEKDLLPADVEIARKIKSILS